MFVISSSMFTPLTEPRWVVSMFAVNDWLAACVFALFNASPRPATVELYEPVNVWLFKADCVELANCEICNASDVSPLKVGLLEICSNEALLVDQLRSASWEQRGSRFISQVS